MTPNHSTSKAEQETIEAILEELRVSTKKSSLPMEDFEASWMKKGRKLYEYVRSLQAYRQDAERAVRGLEMARYYIDFAPTKEEGASKAYKEIIDSLSSLQCTYPSEL